MWPDDGERRSKYTQNGHSDVRKHTENKSTKAQKSTMDRSTKHKGTSNGDEET